jgi:hypothetical protein
LRKYVKKKKAMGLAIAKSTTSEGNYFECLSICFIMNQEATPSNGPNTNVTPSAIITLDLKLIYLYLLNN